MLKSLNLGGKEIPVPIPLLHLSEAVDWIQDVLAAKGSVVTKISLNGKDVLGFGVKRKKQIKLNEKTKIEVQIDSPRDLSLQTLDAVRDLTNAIEAKFKFLAVACWQQTSDLPLLEIKEITADMHLVQELLSHISGIVDYSQKEMAPVSGLSRLIAYPLKELSENIKKSDWKRCAHLLLNRLEPLLKELVQECDILQLSLLSSDNEETFSIDTTGTNK